MGKSTQGHLTHQGDSQRPHPVIYKAPSRPGSCISSYRRTASNFSHRCLLPLPTTQSISHLAVTSTHVSPASTHQPSLRCAGPAPLCTLRHRPWSQVTLGRAASSISPQVLTLPRSRPPTSYFPHTLVHTITATKSACIHHFPHTQHPRSQHQTGISTRPRPLLQHHVSSTLSLLIRTPKAPSSSSHHQTHIPVHNCTIMRYSH